MQPDQNGTSLLFATLAMQMNLLRKETFVDCLNSWAKSRSRSLTEIVIELAKLTPEQCDWINKLVVDWYTDSARETEAGIAASDPFRTVAPTLTTPPGQNDATLDTPSILRPEFASFGSSTISSQRYRILRPHARGGLGEVLVAQDQELNREVALKQIQNRHADDVESRLRFLLEAEVTGSLEHPGIVPVYGLGSYSDGRPYYAMRFIKGESLRDAIERFHSPTNSQDASKRAVQLRQLLTRFVTVCNTIAYAHSRGVLHRDIKPANIMLGPFGETLVVDWGLAKTVGFSEDLGKHQISQTLSSASLSIGTQMGLTIGTPQFMSPEQAAGKQNELGPASDIYSLGATLYNLLTGKPSVSGPDLDTILSRVEKGDILSPRMIRPDIPRPLEAVCLKAMRLEPGERYPGASGLAADIENYLADEPVSAWKEPWHAKTRRWVNRHRTLVTTLASGLCIAAMALTVTTFLLAAANDRERQARAAAETNERQAHANFQLARDSVDHYLTNVSEEILLHEPGMQQLRVKLLQNARTFYERFVHEQTQQPTLKMEFARATFRLAQIIGEIDSPKEAIRLHLQAKELLGEILELDPTSEEIQVDLASCKHHLGRLYRLTDQLEKAESHGKEAVRGWAALTRDFPNIPRYRAELARGLNVLANTYQVKRELKNATDADLVALGHWSALHQADPTNPEFRRYLALSHNHLGMVYNDSGEAERAEKSFTTALKLRKSLTEKYSHVSQYMNDLASTYFNLGDLFAQVGNLPRAEEPFRQAASLWDELHRKHPLVTSYQTNLAETLSALTRVHLQSRNVDKATTTSAQALQLRQELADRFADHPGYQSALAEGHFRQGDVFGLKRDFVQAEKSYQQAVGIQAQLTTQYPGVPQHRADFARTLNNLGLFYLSQKKHSDAEQSFTQAIGHWEALTTNHPKEVEYALELARTAYNLGNFNADTKQTRAAVAYYTQSIAALEKPFPEKMRSALMRRILANTYKERALLRSRLKQYQSALSDHDQAIANCAVNQKLWFQVYRTTTLARSGQHHAAWLWVQSVSEQASKDGNASFQLARILALASQAASNDAQLSAKERDALLQQYNLAAVKLLQSSQQTGYFSSTARGKLVTEDADFTSLHNFPAFQDWLRQLNIPQPR